MRKCLILALTTVGAFLLFAGNALAGTSSAKDCSVCQFKPAIATTTTTSSSSSSSKTHIRVVKTLRSQVRQYEKVKHIRVAIAGGRPMSGTGCINPAGVRSWGFQNGEGFINADRFHRELPDHWRPGWRVCNWKIVKNWHGHHGTWVVGQKMNCRNTPIAIPIKGTPAPRVKTQVVEFTTRTFRSTYDKWVTKSTSSTSTGTTTTTFSCDAYGSGWTLTTERGSNECKLCPPTPCPTPAKAHAWLTKVAYKDGATVSLSGGEFTFSVSVNGGSSSSTTNAASGQSRDLGQFNPGDSVQVCETNSAGYTPDQQCISHTMAAGENFTFSFSNRKTSPPPPSNCVTITSTIDLNDVPVGKNSGQMPFTVNSCGTGSVTIDPGNGAISKCDSSTPQASVSFDLVAGNNSFCVIYYAPNDSSATTGSITYTATQGSAKDVKVDNFDITNPTRP